MHFPNHPLRQLVFTAAVSFLLASVLNSQTDSRQRNSTSKVETQQLQITECENDACGRTNDDVTWTFASSTNGSTGTGKFGTGSQPLILEHFDHSSITVRRTDTTGSWLGSAIYTGHIDGTLIEGKVVYIDPNSSQHRTGTWSGIIGSREVALDWASRRVKPASTPDNAAAETPASSRPVVPASKPKRPVLRASSGKKQVNMNGIWVGGLTYQDKQILRFFRVERKADEFSMCVINGPKVCNKDAVSWDEVCAPIDDGGPCIEKTSNHGRFATDSQVEFVDAKDRMIIDNPDSMHTEHGFKMLRLVYQPEDVPCDEANSFHMMAPATFARVKDAINRDGLSEALCYLRVGAAGGDPRSQSLYSNLLYFGEGVPQDFKAAFDWAQKAADQHEFLGELMLSVMYQTGNGAPRDQQKSAQWSAQADQDFQAKFQLVQEGPRWLSEDEFARRSRAEQQALMYRTAGAVIELLRGITARGTEADRRQLRTGENRELAEFHAGENPNVQEAEQRGDRALGALFQLGLGGGMPYLGPNQQQQPTLDSAGIDSLRQVFLAETRETRNWK